MTASTIQAKSPAHVLPFGGPICGFDELEGVSQKLSKSGSLSVLGAWKQGGGVDPFGEVWLNEEYLARAIGTSAELAEFFTLHSGRCGRGSFAGETFFKGERVREFTRLSDKKNLPDASEQCYEAFYDSPYAVTCREKFARLRKRLEQERKRRPEFGPFDELSGDTFLLFDMLEFVYIRMPRFYDDLKGESWNGLLVGAETRDRILDYGVADEVDLFELCRREDWSMDWVFSSAAQIEAVGREFLLPNEIVSGHRNRTTESPLAQVQTG